MRTKELIYELMIFKNGATFSRYDILNAMQEYADEYHRAELLKLNKSDVISSLPSASDIYLESRIRTNISFNEWWKKQLGNDL